MFLICRIQEISLRSSLRSHYIQHIRIINDRHNATTVKLIHIYLRRLLAVVLLLFLQHLLRRSIIFIMMLTHMPLLVKCVIEQLGTVATYTLLLVCRVVPAIKNHIELVRFQSSQVCGLVLWTLGIRLLY